MPLPTEGELPPLATFFNLRINLTDRELGKELMKWAEHIRGLKKRTPIAHEIMLTMFAAAVRLDPPERFPPDPRGTN